MYPAPFEYHTPKSVDEAVTLLGKLGDDAKLLAGGHSLIPIMKLRFAQPAHLIDVRKISGLSGIREEGGAIVIGATTTHAQLEGNALIQQKLPVLAQAARAIGDAQVRNVGTIGGSLAHADPGADLPAVMLALEAEITAVGAKGKRTITAADFFVGMMQSALGPRELLTQIRIPLPAAGTASAYEKYPHPASRYALVGAAVVITMSGKTISRARVAVTGIGTKASRATATEKALEGKTADAASIDAAAALAANGIDVRVDAQGSEEYKRNLAAVYVGRAIRRALKM